MVKKESSQKFFVLGQTLPPRSRLPAGRPRYKKARKTAQNIKLPHSNLPGSGKVPRLAAHPIKPIISITWQPRNPK